MPGLSNYEGDDSCLGLANKFGGGSSSDKLLDHAMPSHSREFLETYGIPDELRPTREPAREFLPAHCVRMTNSACAAIPSSKSEGRRKSVTP